MLYREYDVTTSSSQRKITARGLVPEPFFIRLKSRAKLPRRSLVARKAHCDVMRKLQQGLPQSLAQINHITTNHKSQITQRFQLLTKVNAEYA